MGEGCRTGFFRWSCSQYWCTHSWFSHSPWGIKLKNALHGFGSCASHFLVWGDEKLETLEVFLILLSASSWGGIQQVLMIISLGFSLLSSAFLPKMSFLYLIYTGGCLSFSGAAFPFSDSECLQHTCKEKSCLSCGIAILNRRSPKVKITSNNVKFSGLQQYQCIISHSSVSFLSPARQSLWSTWYW